MVKASNEELKTEHVAVYFTKDEVKKLNKEASKELLATSPFVRKKVLEAINQPAT